MKKVLTTFSYLFCVYCVSLYTATKRSELENISELTPVIVVNRSSYPIFMVFEYFKRREFQC